MSGSSFPPDCDTRFSSATTTAAIRTNIAIISFFLDAFRWHYAPDIFSRHLSHYITYLSYDITYSVTLFPPSIIAMVVCQSWSQLLALYSLKLAFASLQKTWTNYILPNKELYFVKCFAISNLKPPFSTMCVWILSQAPNDLTGCNTDFIHLWLGNNYNLSIRLKQCPQSVCIEHRIDFPLH